MEAVLDLSAEPFDPTRPVVGFDEMPSQLVGEVQPPVPGAPGRPQRIDYEYERKGTCNLFLVTPPLAGWRHVDVTERRTKQDFAHQMKALVDEHFPEAEVIRVVVDNLNTHTPAALSEAFPPAEAHRLTRKLEFWYTPKHGSWLNVAEIELAVMAKQCLDRRIGDPATLRHELAAWEAKRNDTEVRIHWQFSTTDARVKLTHLYPS